MLSHRLFRVIIVMRVKMKMKSLNSLSLISHYRNYLQTQTQSQSQSQSQSYLRGSLRKLLRKVMVLASSHERTISWSRSLPRYRMEPSSTPPRASPTMQCRLNLADRGILQSLPLPLRAFSHCIYIVSALHYCRYVSSRYIAKE